LIKYDIGDLLVDSHDTVDRWKHDISKLWNIHIAYEFSDPDIHTAIWLVPESS